jgi:hypothetical protein
LFKLPLNISSALSNFIAPGWLMLASCLPTSEETGLGDVGGKEQLLHFCRTVAIAEASWQAAASHKCYIATLLQSSRKKMADQSIAI